MKRHLLLGLFLCACGEGEISSGGAGEDFGRDDPDLAGLDGIGGFGTPDPRPDRLLPPGGGSVSPADLGVASAPDGFVAPPTTPPAPDPDAFMAPPTMPPPPPTEPPPPPDTPVCGCVFGNGRYCASSARDLEGPNGCQVPVAHEQPDALLRCTDAAWSVEQACEAGCEVRPPGEADRCASPPPGPDDGLWHLPWRCGDTYRCTQGNDGDICGGGVGSHTGRQRFAYDFGMPRGTRVVAARAGEVIFSDNRVGPGQDCYDGCNDGACCDRCINTVNRVVLRHGDGTTSLYLHLDRATAQVGAMVSAGDELGVSGISGCSFGAHLHFQVQSDCGIWFCDSQGIDFSENADMACGAQNASGNCR